MAARRNPPPPHTPTSPAAAATNDSASSVAPVDLIAQQDPGLRQLRLDNFIGWVITRPGAATSGYIASVNDAKNLAMTVLWKGGATPFQKAIRTEAGKRGIKGTFDR